MADDLVSLYSKFVDYVTCLHRDLDRGVGRLIPPEHRARLLSYDEFCRMWYRWGNTEGLQQVWRRRFDSGYHQVALDLHKRLDAAVGCQNSAASHPVTREAA
jgi:hypothetical protein